MAEQRRITPDDLRAKFDEINDVVMGGVERQRTNAITTVVVVGAVVVAAAFLLGAEAEQMGTRMVSAAESPIHDHWKQAICGATEADTLLLNQHSAPALRALRTRSL